ncbi:T9SS type A sorting domain-containing protein [Cryomorphaceae bacterium 1068]|nr:T9SS type A sorting domain-containing protein [Cryomorphaceae bacterium 1068]
MMKKILTCLALSLLFCIPTHSQTDQTLDWFTYIGGPSFYQTFSGFEKKEGVAFGADNEVYIAGRESNEELLFGSGINQDSVSGGVDAFLIRFSDDGQFAWSNYFGGPQDDLFETMCSANGKIIISGTTLSDEGIVFGDAHQIERAGEEDLFLAAFNPDGTLEWSTYFGGLAAESSAVIKSSPDGSIILAGRTLSSNLSTSGAFDETFDPSLGANSFLAKFSGDGSLLWCTYLPANTDVEAVGALVDSEESISTDGNGNIYIAIDTDSEEGLATQGAYQTSGSGNSIVLAKFSPNGNLVWSTYVSGSWDEYQSIITADPDGNVYLSGVTGSYWGIATEGAHQGGNESVGNYSGFLMKFSPDGERLWGTFYGGTWSPAADYIEWIEGGVLLNYRSSAYDDSFNSNPFQFELNGSSDVFITKFSSEGQAIWITAFGGENVDSAGGIAVNGNNFAVCGSTRSEEFYGDENSWQEDMNGGSDLYLAQFEDNMSSGPPDCANPFPAVENSSINTTFAGTSYLLEWEAVPYQIGCQVDLRFANGNPLLKILVGDVQSYFLSGSVLEYGTDYAWRVRCGCSQSPIVAGPWSAWQPFTTPDAAGLVAYPNPTEGFSQVTFSVKEPQYTTLEVLDMNGRIIERLFAGNTSPDAEYRFDFDGSGLPNGVYLYRLTTEKEVVNEKVIIAR